MKDKLVAEMLTNKAKDNSMVDLDTYSNGLADMYDRLVNSFNLPVVSDNASDFEKDLFKLINNYCKNGLKKPDLIKKMEWATYSCKDS